MYQDYKLIDIRKDGRVAYATVDNPPINIMTWPLYEELERLSRDVEADDDIVVFVLRSANPDFFIAHFDVEEILRFPVEGPAQREEEMMFYHQMCERYRTMPKVTIAQIEGRIGGGGSELAASMDMRFGVRGKTIVNQMEVPLGILPGGTGTQRLPRLIGRGRALEIILAGTDLDAETAERWGYLNRALAAEEIGPFVETLARRIASFPVEAVRAAKEAVNAAELPLREGLREEAYLFQTLLRTESGSRNMRKFLEIGGQTRDGELRIGELSAELGRATSQS